MLTASQDSATTTTAAHKKPKPSLVVTLGDNAGDAASGKAGKKKLGKDKDKDQDKADSVPPLAGSSAATKPNRPRRSCCTYTSLLPEPD